MKFTGWLMSAGLVLAASAASAQSSIQQGSTQQGLAPQEIGGPRYAPVSDFEGPGPYAAMPPEAPDPRYGAPMPRYGGPMLLPPEEVYTVLRKNRFSPLGAPQQRGFIYVISVVDRTGEDGRLVIDARSGQIIRFMPAHRMGNNFNDDLSGSYGPAGLLPPVSSTRGPPRPPGSVPHVASRAPQVPVPKPPPPRADEVKPLAEKPVAPPPQQSAAVAPKPADAQVAPQASAPPAAEAKPAAPQIAPTQEMPKVQGLE
jgi:hypothetical protein